MEFWLQYLGICNGETYVGEIEIKVSVVRSKAEILSKDAIAPSQTRDWRSADKLPDKIIQGPDIIIIYMKKELLQILNMMY